MLEARPCEDFSAKAVIDRLDLHDFMEAELTRGAPTSNLALFADWRSMEPIRVASFVAYTAPYRGALPFAVFGLVNTGQAGVAQAALLARNHAYFRRPLAELGAMIRRGMPIFAAERGIHRIEARAWAGHPTASGLLTGLGFAHECDMAGFGLSGAITFRQFAWVSPAIGPVPLPDTSPVDPIHTPERT